MDMERTGASARLPMAGRARGRADLTIPVPINVKTPRGYHGACACCDHAADEVLRDPGLIPSGLSASAGSAARPARQQAAETLGHPGLLGS